MQPPLHPTYMDGLARDIDSSLASILILFLMLPIASFPQPPPFGGLHFLTKCRTRRVDSLRGPRRKRLAVQVMREH